MELNDEIVTYILNVVKTAKLVQIDNVIIEPGFVRAMDDNKTVILYQNENVPDMPFNSIGLTRTDSFLARYDIAQTQDDFTIDAIVKDDEKFTRSLVMKAKKTKIDYRCANPDKITAPKQVNDELKCCVPLDGDTIFLMQKGQAAMNADVVTLISTGEEVWFELVDVNNDVFKHTITTKVKAITEDKDVKFAHRYPVKILLSLFKNNPSGEFYIGKKGILSFAVNGLTVFVVPQV